MIRYTHLTELEIEEADRVAHAVHNRADENDLEDYQQDETRSGIALNISGFRGEKAFSKMTGLEWIASKKKYSGPDFVIGGLMIDVKTSKDYGKAKPIMFIFKGKEKRPCHIYVLIWERRDSNLYSIMGWQYSDIVFREENLHSSRDRKPCYRVMDLESPDKLFKIIEERRDYG